MQDQKPNPHRLGFLLFCQCSALALRIMATAIAAEWLNEVDECGTGQYSCGMCARAGPVNRK
jgi:hypothetical protein